MEVLLGLPPLHVMIKVEPGICTLLCSQQWKPKSTNFGHAGKSWDMKHEPILQTGTDRMIPRHTYHKPFMVKFPDKCEWQKGFNLCIKGLVYRQAKDQSKTLVLGCTDGAQEVGRA